MKVIKKVTILFFSIVIVNLLGQSFPASNKSNAESMLPVPSPPTIEVGEGSSSIKVIWDAPNDHTIAGYRLYRSEDDINYFSVQDRLIQNTYFVDTRLSREKRYYYRLSFVDEDDNESPLSDSVTGSMNQYALDKNMLTNSQFTEGLEGWSIGTHKEVVSSSNIRWTEASPTLIDGYDGLIRNAGKTIEAQGKSMQFLISEANRRAKTTVYQRKLEVVPTGKPVQLSFAWKKDCSNCEPADVQISTKINEPKQNLRIELLKPDSSWVILWEHTAIANMEQYALVENLDITDEITQAGTYDIRVIAELSTGYDNVNVKNEIVIDELFLNFERGPLPITEMTVDVVNEGKALLLNWRKSDEEIDGYYIYRSTEETGPFERINDQPVTEASFFDKNLQNGQMYYYKVRAIRDGIESSDVRSVRGVPVYIDPINHPHHTYSENTNACASCHITHKAKAERILKESTEAATCITCHNGTGSQYDTNSQFTDKDASSHPVKGTPTAANGAMQCSSCHNPHATNGFRATLSQLNGSLAKKSGVAVEYSNIPFSEPISFVAKDIIEKDRELCFSCHSTSNTKPVATETTSSAKEFHPANMSGHGSEYTSRLSGIGDYINGWSATANVTCTDCHGSGNVVKHEGVHGSMQQNLLKKDFSSKTVGTDSDALCFTCHNQATYGGNSNMDASMNTTGMTRFKSKVISKNRTSAQTGINLHNYWNDRTNRGHLGAACTQCHSAVPHSAEKYPALLVDLEDSKPYQQYTENTNVKIYYPVDGDWTQNSCGTTGAGCHNNTN